MSAQLMPDMATKTGYGDKVPVAENRNGAFPGLVLIILIVSSTVILGFKLADPATLPVRHVSVTGDFVHLSPSGLEKHVSEVVRGGFFNVNVETIQNVLLEEPWIREVSVNRIWPDRIVVNIREQTAVARWGGTGLLNSDARIFSPDPRTFPGNLPVLAGPDGSAGLLLERLLQVGKILPKGAAVSRLVLNERRSWRLQLDNGLVMRLGKEDVVGRIKQFFEYYPVSDSRDLGRIRYVDMRYTNGFVIRWQAEHEPELNSG